MRCPHFRGNISAYRNWSGVTFYKVTEQLLRLSVYYNTTQNKWLPLLDGSGTLLLGGVLYSGASKSLT